MSYLRGTLQTFRGTNGATYPNTVEQGVGSGGGGGTAITYIPTSTTVWTLAAGDIQNLGGINGTVSATATVKACCVRSAVSFLYNIKLMCDFTGQNFGTPQILLFPLYLLPDYPGFSDWANIKQSVVVTNGAEPPTVTQSGLCEMTDDGNLQFKCTNVGDVRRFTWDITFVQ